MGKRRRELEALRGVTTDNWKFCKEVYSGELDAVSFC